MLVVDLDVPIPGGEAGQTKPGVILCHQVRTVSLTRARAMVRRTGDRVHYVTDPAIRAQVREALRRHFGLDLPATLDGAETRP